MSITIDFGDNNEGLREKKEREVDKLVNQLIFSKLALQLLNSLMIGSKNNDSIVKKILQNE